MDLPLDLSGAAPGTSPGEPAEPYLLTRPPRQTVPLVFASPHSGRHYPPSFVAAARLDPVALRRSEDGFVDELFAAAPEHGAPLLAAAMAGEVVAELARLAPVLILAMVVVLLLALREAEARRSRCCGGCAERCCRANGGRVHAVVVAVVVHREGGR